MKMTVSSSAPFELVFAGTLDDYERSYSPHGLIFLNEPVETDNCIVIQIQSHPTHFVVFSDDRSWLHTSHDYACWMSHTKANLWSKGSLCSFGLSSFYGEMVVSGNSIFLADVGTLREINTETGTLSSQILPGYIDEIRVIDGVVKYTLS